MTTPRCGIRLCNCLSSVEIKPATNDRNDPASEFCVRYYERRGIFLSNKPDTKELQRVVWKKNADLRSLGWLGHFAIAGWIEVIADMLDSDGLQAQSFEDAEVFFAHARSHSVHLALIDVWMPETSGLQVQARLRKESPDTKVIMMTGRETPAIRAAALEGGAFGFLVKPFDDEAFLCLVHQTLRLAA
jgi:CheY-like chemotaxis protein